MAERKEKPIIPLSARPLKPFLGPLTTCSWILRPTGSRVPTKDESLRLDSSAPTNDFFVGGGYTKVSQGLMNPDVCHGDFLGSMDPDSSGIPRNLMADAVPPLTRN